MKIYKIKVNGKIYEVELESVEEKNQAMESNVSDDPRPKQNKNPEGQTIKSPMQGTIQKVLVKPGQRIKKGTSMLILEAMKLENDITADKDYLILDLLVKEGDTVDSNQALITVG